MTKEQVVNAIYGVCKEMAEFLIEKNNNYGNSVFAPIKCFSKAGAEERINIRIDDKISRLICGEITINEDTEKDLAGYILLKFAGKKLGVVKEKESI